MFKIAYCAGHYLGTPGKRVPAALDTNQTREWVLNDRVADWFSKAALEYEDVEVMRTDDPTGETFIDIPERTAKANRWEADVYVDMHHNAAGRVFDGGGVEAYSYPGSAQGKKYRDSIYAAVIAAGGLRGNRSQPLQEKRFDSLSQTYMPAVLMEYGFMDSTADYPVISQESYAKLVAYATMEGIARVAGLKKRQAQTAPASTNTAKGDYTVEMKNLEKGMSGENVRALQILLNGYGYNSGTADGIFGAKTDAAVRAYQKAKGIQVDGIAGKNTMGRLLGITS